MANARRRRHLSSMLSGSLLGLGSSDFMKTDAIKPSKGLQQLTKKRYSLFP